MKFISTSPFKSQNTTHFTFWEVSLLEIQDVLLIRGNRLLVPPERRTCPLQFPQAEVLFSFPLNSDRRGISSGRSERALSKNSSEEADLKTRALSSHSTLE